MHTPAYNALVTKRFDVCVQGAGAVGKALALALSRQGFSVALVQGAQPSAAAREDVRAYALNAGSIALLAELKVWDALPAHGAATPVLDMRIEGDARGRLEFSAWEQRVRELAWIVDAVAARLVCEREHMGVAWQWFRSPDVLALLPFDRPEAGRSFGLVWSVPAERAQQLLALDEADFSAALNEAAGPAPGALKLASQRAAWPLSIGRAVRWCGPGWVLLGDAAHVVHPLAGQGLNLGLGDVATLARVLAGRQREEPWRPLGDERLLSRYVRERASPTWTMAQLTDGLLHLFAQPGLPLRELRNNGLTLVHHLKPLKRWLAGQAFK
jgi:2-polyprenyl-6-methoxyphenol hydroxylase-like FAD-dependent oxidoreductase